MSSSLSTKLLIMYSFTLLSSTFTYRKKNQDNTLIKHHIFGRPIYEKVYLYYLDIEYPSHSSRRSSKSICVVVVITASAFEQRYALRNSISRPVLVINYRQVTKYIGIAVVIGTITYFTVGTGAIAAVSALVAEATPGTASLLWSIFSGSWVDCSVVRKLLRRTVHSREQLRHHRKRNSTMCNRRPRHRRSCSPRSELCR